MLRVYSCLVTDHDIRLVLFAAAICLLSTLAAFMLAGHVHDQVVSRRRPWIVLTGLVTGAGIWATHFIAMLAYQPDLPTVYDLGPTLASIFVAMLMAAAGWWTAASGARHAHFLASMIITAGIGIMHFTGMSAMKTTGIFAYDQSMVIMSCFASGVFVAIALAWTQWFPQRFPVIPALWLTLGICTLHFGSMAAATIIPTGNISLPAQTISKHEMTFIVGTLVLLLLAAALATALLDARFARFSLRIQHLSSHDSLTGMANMLEFNALLGTAVGNCRSENEAVALLSIGLDRFKDLNDLHGHQIGDSVIVEVARRIELCAGNVSIARLGGDEFAIIVRDGDPGRAACELSQRIVDAIGMPMVISDVTVRTGASIGIATFPEDARDEHELRRFSNLALRRAKNSIRGKVCRYEPTTDQAIHDQQILENALQSALVRNEFSIHYQPLACAKTGGVIGFEALLRWNHPELGDIPPSQFIPLTEASGLIVEIGAWVLNESCHQAATWGQPLKVAVNLSAVQFADQDLITKVGLALSRSGLAPSRLELEITEGVLIQDTLKAQSVLHEIKQMGVRIAMDDFGTGFSSLSYFRQFPFDKVKIDQSFVNEMAHSRQSMAVVKAVIGLGNALDMPVLAEGVETVEQFEILSTAGCQQIQGYLIGKPEAPAHYERYTSRGNTESHACDNLCNGCLERLRPPCGVKAIKAGWDSLTAHRGPRLVA
jgi:diguanylate cyclase (GGDEF)-like protein